MAEIKDDIGRIGNFQDIAMDKISSMLTSAVGKAVKYVSEKAKSSASDQDYKNLTKALEELGDNIQENLKSTKNFIDEIKEASKFFDKRKESGKSEGKSDLEGLQREQNKILGMILDRQRKAQSAKVAKYTSGGSSVAKLSLSDMGFKPKGTDRIPAMLSPGEFVVNRRGASRNYGILDKMNRGYSLGGIVKPKYLSEGTQVPGPTGSAPIGGAEVVVENVRLSPAAATESREVGEALTKYINEGLRDSSKREISSWLTGMSTALMGGKADFLQSLFAGSVTDAMDFQREMRLVAFQTKGVTGDLRGMQSEFSNLGKSVSAETGKSVSLLQRVYLSNMKKGFKDNKQGLQVMKSGLFLSTMIGSEAQQTAELFGDWHRTLALSSEEMSQLSRDMRNVAMSTGVTGDELLGAMKASEGILKNLRNQGNLTASTSESVIEMMAEAKKMGFEENTAKYLTAMSSHSSMMNADSSTKALLFSASNLMGGDASRKMMTGTFMKDRENLAGLSKSLKTRVASQLGMTADQFDFEKLTQDEKDLLALRLRSYGIELAEAENLIRVTEKAGKGLAGNLEEFDKIASSDFSTEAEKQLASKQKDQALLNHSLNYLSAIGKQAKNKNLSEALTDSYSSAEFKDKKQDFSSLGKYLTSEMKSMYGIGGTNEQMAQQLSSLDPTKAAELNALILSDQLNKMASEQGIGLDKDYSREIKNALAKGDNAKFRELVAEAEKKASEISVEQQASTSPEEKLALEINKLNETIRGYTSSFLRGTIDLIGAMGLLAIQVGIMSTMLYTTVGKGLLDFSGIMKGLFPKGGFKGLKDMLSEGGLKGLKDFFFKKQSKLDAMSIAEFRKLRQQGLSLKDAFDVVKSRGGFEKESLFSSLKKSSDKLGDNLRDTLIKGVDDVGKKGNRVFNKLGNRVSYFGKKVKDSFSGAWGAFKNARKGSSGLGWIKKGKGRLAALTDATDFFIENMTGKVGKFSELIDVVSNSTPIKKTKGMFDALFKSFAKGRKAFGVMRSGNKNILSSLAVGFDQFFKNVSGGIKPFEKMSSLFSLFISKIKNFKLSSLVSLPGMLIKGVGGMIKGVRSVMSKGVGGMIKGFGSLFRGGAKLASKGLRAALIGGTGGLAQIAFAALDGIFGAFSGFSNTGKHFEGVMKAMGKSTKDMTWGMYASSTVAGALVGILDGLTFGMLSLTGAAAWLNQTLSLVLYTVFSFIEGIIEGIMVPLEAVWSAFKYIGTQFKSMGDSLLGVFNSIAGLFGAEAGNWSEAFAMIYPWLKAIGKVIGMVIGMPLAGVLWLVVKAISALLVPVQMFINAIAGVVKVFRGVIDFFFDIFRGNIRKAFRNLGSVVGGAIYGVFKPILDFLWSIGADFLAPIKKLFSGIPKGMYDWIYSAAGSIPGGQWLMDWLFGKKKAAAEAAAASAGKNAAASGSRPATSANPSMATNSPRRRSLEEQIAITYGSDTAARATAQPRRNATEVVAGVPGTVDRASATASTPVGHHAVPVLTPNENQDVGAVQPVHLRDITGSILRDKAGSSGTGKIQSDELARIEEASYKQVTELEQIRQGINEMVGLLKPKGSGVVGGTGDSERAGTKDPRRPLHAARFGKMKYGKVGGNANRSLVNNGES